MIFWLLILIFFNIFIVGLVYSHFHKKKDLLDIRFVFTLLLTFPPLVSLINGMLIFFMDFSMFVSILISGFLGLLIGGLIGSIFNLITFSFSSLISFYFGLMGPMVATPIISPNLCGIYTLGDSDTNILLLSSLGSILISMFSMLYINLLKN